METLEKTSLDNKQEDLNNRINGLLYALELLHTARSTEASDSRELLKVGEKTELIKTIENLLKSPLTELAKTKEWIDGIGAEILNEFVKVKLLELKDKAHVIFKVNTSNADLLYCVVLKEDSIQNRQLFFNIIDWAEESDLGKKYYLNVRFIRAESALSIPRTDVIVG